jgi:hypothetical protein
MAAHFDDYFGHGVPDSIRDLACEFCGHRAGYMEREICDAIVCPDSRARGQRLDARCTARRRPGVAHAA